MYNQSHLAPKLDGYVREEVLDKRAYIYQNDTIFSTSGAFKLGSAATSDLREFSIGKHNQRNTGSCVGQSTVKGLEIFRVAHLGPDAHVDLSRAQLYYLLRELRAPKYAQVDEGGYISHAFKALNHFGVCEEKYWPFVQSKINDSPGLRAMRKAYVHRIKSYHRIEKDGSSLLDAVCHALSQKRPVVWGTLVDKSWQSYGKKGKGQVLGVPKMNDILGGHATCIVGYDGRNFIIENSWGDYWGYGGYAFVHPDVLEASYSNDFHVITDGWQDV